MHITKSAAVKVTDNLKKEGKKARECFRYYQVARFEVHLHSLYDFWSTASPFLQLEELI